MNILFLIRQLNYAGAERQLVTLAKGLQQHGHTVSVAVFYPDGPLEKDLREVGVPVHSLDKNGRWDTLSFIWRLLKLVWQKKPDILHGYLNVSNILAVLVSTICPSLRVVWGVRSSNMDLKKYDRLTRVLYRCECWLSRFADLIIVNSYAGVRYAAANGFPGEKMIVIPNGIDTDRFQPDSEARRRMRVELGVRDDQKLIGLIGRFDPMKDHETFLKAASLMREQKRLMFLCMGAGSSAYKQHLIEMGGRMGLDKQLIWSDARDDMSAVYNALDVMVSSSSSEGFSNVIAEAMACGIPCVVTDVGDSALIVGGDGEVVPPRDAQALKVAIERSIEKDRADAQETILSRQQIIDRFSVAELEARTERVLLQLCESAT